MSAICCIKVTPETSPLVQEVLFSYGWCWNGLGKNVYYTEVPYLFIYEDKDICYGDNRDDDKEVSFHELLVFLKTGKFPKKDVTFSSKGFNVVISEDGTKISQSTDCKNIPNDLILEIAEKIKCF